jgi:hypothetical protein
MLVWGGLALVIWSLAACSSGLPAAPANDTAAAAAPSQEEPAETAAPVETSAPVETPTAEATSGEATVTALAFAGNGDTFLEAIAAGLGEYGTPDERRYLEVDDGVGTLWQGEQLVYPEVARTYLQPIGDGGGSAVLIESASDADLAAILADPAAQATATGVNDPSTVTFPEIRGVDARQSGDAWSFNVTLAYPDTGWEDYADGWQVETPDGQILGLRILFHPHVNEQPFTRSMSGVVIPPDVSEVVIRSHTLVNGYGPEVERVQIED